MESFLRKTKENLLCLDKFAVIRVVMGNEACDLDSCACALAYSYYLHQDRGGQEVMYLPVFNIPSEDYRLHTEVTYFLGQHGLSQELLTFRDQVDLETWHSVSKLQLTLVDHNVLPTKDTSLEEAVIEVIDHHVKERLDSEKVSVTLERVGSCCTLVASKLISDERFTIDSEIAKLLFGAIVMDTGNFSDALNIATPKDHEVISKLEQCGVNITRHDVYEALKSAKSNLGGLTTLEILRKDLKVVSSPSLNIAISSVSGDLQVLLDRDDLETALGQFATHQDAAVILLMFLSVNESDVPSRQLAVYSENLVYREQICSLLMTADCPSLALSLLPTSRACLVSYDQANVQASRKIILPLIKAYVGRQTAQ